MALSPLDLRATSSPRVARRVRLSSGDVTLEGPTSRRWPTTGCVAARRDIQKGSGSSWHGRCSVFPGTIRPQEGGMGLETADGDRVFLSTLPVGRGERRLALTVVLVSAAIFLTVVPFARFPFAPVLAFI